MFQPNNYPNLYYTDPYKSNQLLNYGTQQNQNMMYQNYQQPYGTNNQFSGNNQMQTQYIQPQQQYQQNILVGRSVYNIEDVSAQEVSMNGINLFPANDMSCIYVKQWNSQGTIDTVRYIKETPAVDIEQSEEQPDYMAIILQRLDNIEKSLSNSSPATPKRTTIPKPQLKKEEQGE